MIRRPGLTRRPGRTAEREDGKDAAHRTRLPFPAGPRFLRFSGAGSPVPVLTVPVLTVPASARASAWRPRALAGN